MEGNKLALNIDNAFGVFPQALNVHENRAEVLANNLANETTPNFKSQDYDFRSFLKNDNAAMKTAKMLNTTDAQHINNSNNFMLEFLQYRTQVQPSLDGNTVDSDVESQQYADNSMRYMANLTFLTKKIQDLMLAINGGT